MFPNSLIFFLLLAISTNLEAVNTDRYQLNTGGQFWTGFRFQIRKIIDLYQICRDSDSEYIFLRVTHKGKKNIRCSIMKKTKWTLILLWNHESILSSYYTLNEVPLQPFQPSVSLLNPPEFLFLLKICLLPTGKKTKFPLKPQYCNEIRKIPAGPSYLMRQSNKFLHFQPK